MYALLCFALCLWMLYTICFYVFLYCSLTLNPVSSSCKEKHYYKCSAVKELPPDTSEIGVNKLEKTYMHCQVLL